MSWTENLVVLLLALALEAGCGYPEPLYRAVGHPVTWMGKLVAVLDRVLNAETRTFARRRIMGAVAVAILIGAVGAAAALASILLSRVGAPGAVLLALAASTLLAQKSLHDHVARVADALRTGGLEEGRAAVAHIVGRDPASLDRAGVCRAAIESLAENFSDGVVAPAFWLAVGGLGGGAAYKAVNTADSMVGHRTPRHEAFGWAAARLDDVLNLPASRLAAGLLIAAAALSPGGRPGEALYAVRRDARRHRSPNAGWPEAAMAGALGLSLAGPRIYGSARVEDAWMGQGRPGATPDDIDRALALYRWACAGLWLLFALMALVLGLR